jgi:hypothetical protein
MKRFLAAAMIAAAALLPAAAQAKPGFFGQLGQMSAAADLGAMCYSGAAGISTDLRFEADIKRSIGFFSPYLGAKLLYGFTSDSAHGESDLYVSAGGGLRFIPSSLPAFSAAPAILKPLILGAGLDLGLGATLDKNSAIGATKGAAGFLLELSLAMEYPLGPVLASFTPGYRVLFTSATVKSTLNLSLGARYLLKEAVK